jgi:hypothetical protein
MRTLTLLACASRSQSAASRSFGLLRLDQRAAHAIIGQVARTNQWQTGAVGAGLTGGEMSQMAPAFEHRQAELARDVLSTIPSAR